MKTIAAVVMSGFLFPTGIVGSGLDQVEVRKIDGVNHILNADKPLKGTVVLEADKIIEIDPYQQPEVGMKFFHIARDESGLIILYDPNTSEAHRYSSRGEYLGPLFKKGQGPGEFSDGIQAQICNGEIWVSDANKVAWFDRNGRYLGETKLGQHADCFVDKDLFFRSERTRDTESIVLERFFGPGDPRNTTTEYFRGSGVGMHRDPAGNRSFANIWVTPGGRFIFDPVNRRFYGGMNNAYQIQVKNLQNETLFVIEKPHRAIKLSRKDKEKICYVRSPADNWKIDICPDVMVVSRGFRLLPNGYLGVLRFTSIEESEYDVFDAEGKFVYVLKHPKDVPFDRMIFHRTGFAVVLEREDGLVYADYRVRNLPEIFK